ncbi:Cyclin-dependent kinase inhibitor 7 [Linum grandiflorum]
MEDSSRHCKRSDGGIESSATAGCSKRMKIDAEDDKLSSTESTRLCSPSPSHPPPPGSSNNSHELWRFPSSPDLKAVSPTTSLNSSVGAEFCSVAQSRASGYSCFSNVESSESAVKEENSSGLADLETKSYETESSSTWMENKFRESTPSSSFTETKTTNTMSTEITYTTDSEVSTPPPTSPRSPGSPPPPPRRPVMRVNVQLQQRVMEGGPTKEELDELFGAREKEDQKRFTERYNFDVVKDVPLEGRYQWVRL